LMNSFNPPIASAIETRDPVTIATKISSIDFQLGEMVRQVTEANGFDSVETINVLERHGLPTALQFVQPLLVILRSDKDSPLRRLKTFEIQALFTENMRRQEIIIDELEQSLKAGESITIRTGTANVLWAQYRAKVRVAKDRECLRANRTRDDLTRELIEAKEKIGIYERALTFAADAAEMEVNDYVETLLLTSGDKK